MRASRGGRLLRAAGPSPAADNKKRPRRSVMHHHRNDTPEAAKVGLASLMRPDEAASDHVRCGMSRYAVAPTQAAAIIAALRARRHCTSEFPHRFPGTYGCVRTTKSSRRSARLSSFCHVICRSSRSKSRVLHHDWFGREIVGPPGRGRRNAPTRHRFRGRRRSVRGGGPPTPRTARCVARFRRRGYRHSKRCCQRGPDRVCVTW